MQSAAMQGLNALYHIDLHLEQFVLFFWDMRDYVSKEHICTHSCHALLLGSMLFFQPDLWRLLSQRERGPPGRGIA